MPPPSVPLEAIRQPALLYDADGRVAEANDLAEALAGRPLAGCTPAAVVGVLEIRSSDGSPLLAADLPAGRALAGEEAVDVPLVVRAADGRTLHILATAAPIRNGDHVVGALECWQDITERRRAEQAAQHQEEFLSSVVNTSPAIVYVYDMETWSNVYANDGIQRVLGYPPELVREMGANLFANLIHPDDLPGAIAFQERILRAADDEILESDLRVRHADGSWHVLHQYERPFKRNPDGSVRQKIGVAIDITEQVRAEEALHESEVYRTIIETAAEGIVISRPDGQYTYANRRMSEMLGYPVEEILGRSSWDFAFDDSRPQIRQARADLRRGDIVRGEVEFRRRDGSVLWSSYNASPIFNDEGEHVANLMMHTDITERKRAEEAVRLHAEELETLMETVPVAIFVSRDPWCHVITGNRTANRLYEEEEDGNFSGTPAPGEPVPPRRFFVEGQEIQGEDLPMQVAAATGREVRNAEIETLLPSGKIRVVLGSAAPLRSADGSVRGSLGAFVDITERREMERALAESERRQAFLLALGDRLRELDGATEIMAVASELIGRHLGANGVVYCEIDEAGACAAVRADWNDGTVPTAVGHYRMDDFGIGDLYRRGQVRRTEDVTADDGGDVAEHCALRIRASLGVPIFRGGRLTTVLAVHSARRRAWTDAEVEVVREAGGRVWSAVERARAEEALRESEERLRLAQENAKIVVWDRDVLTGELTLSHRPSWFSTLAEGRPARFEDWQGQVHPEDIARVESERAAALARGEPFDVEYRIVCPSGEVRWVASVGRGFWNDAGDLVRVLGMVTDITERKEIELALTRSAEELRRSNEELQRFAYVASHDLQEPLRSIVSFSQLLERRYRGQLGEDADEYIGFIVDGGTRMQALIQDLLQVSRVETGAKPAAPTDAREVVADAVRSLEIPVREAGARVEVGELPTVMVDAAQLEQVFVNLIGNALKYRRPDVPPVIGISAERTDGMVEFSVADNGIGIEAEYHDRIFEMFRRLHTHEKYEGTGIGLAVVKRIVERHGGTIRVESTPGEGSTFVFTLPAA